MTKKEKAIEMIRVAFDVWEEEYGRGDDWSEEHEARDMAIKALEQEPCEDAVSRKAVLEYIEGSDAELGHRPENEIVCQDIKELPPVTPTRKKGKWIKHDTGHSIYYDCSLCGCVAPCTETADKILWKLSNYCPYCGAEMESEDDSN